MKYIIAVILLSFVTVNADDPICQEAENTKKVTPPFKISQAKTVKEKKAVSQAKFLEISQGQGSGSQKGGEAQFSFEIPKDGTYYFWARVWWLDSCGNSFAVKVGKYPPLVVGNDNTFKRWQWIKAKARFKLSKGIVPVIVQNREDGIKVDQLLLTADKEYVPTGFE